MTDPSAVIELNMGALEGQATAAVADGLTSTTSLLDKVILLALSNPFTYYFLTFVNFFTLSSYYVLLDMPMPRQLYEHLSKFYREVNSNVISREWVLPFNAPSSEGVTRSKLISLSLTTDLSTGQLANLLMALFNILLFLLISCFCSRLARGRLLRKLLYQPHSEILVGQYVSVLLPLTAPWFFFLWEAAPDLPSRLNLVCQKFLFGLSLCFPFLYWLHLAKPKPTILRPHQRASTLVA